MKVVIEVNGKKLLGKLIEEGKNYAVLAVYFELPNVSHIDFSIVKEGKILAKGELAKVVRDSNIRGLEMAVAPPRGTNALIMIRVVRDKYEDVLKEVGLIMFRFLREKNFLTF